MPDLKTLRRDSTRQSTTVATTTAPDSPVTYFFAPSDFDLELALEVFAVLPVLFALLLGGPHLLLEDVQNVGALDVVDRSHCVAPSCPAYSSP